VSAAVAAEVGRLALALQRGAAISVAAREVLSSLDLGADAEGRDRVAKLVAMARDEAQDAVAAGTAALARLAGFDSPEVAS
jgi:hypothetical protein